MKAKVDAKILAVLHDMTRAELVAVILGAGYALPASRTQDDLSAMVRSLYQNGVIDSADILAEYEAGL